MLQSRFREEKIIRVVNQADAGSPATEFIPPPDLCQGPLFHLRQTARSTIVGAVRLRHESRCADEIPTFPMSRFRPLPDGCCTRVGLRLDWAPIGVG